MAGGGNRKGLCVEKTWHQTREASSRDAECTQIGGQRASAPGLSTAVATSHTATPSLCGSMGLPDQRRPGWARRKNVKGHSYVSSLTACGNVGQNN